MNGREIYSAGDALSPSPDLADAAGIAAWIPRAEAWIASARTWRASPSSDSDSWSYYVDAKLNAVSQKVDSLKTGMGTPTVHVPEPVAVGFGYQANKAAEAIAHASWTPYVVAAVVVIGAGAIALYAVK